MCDKEDRIDELPIIEPDGSDQAALAEQTGAIVAREHRLYAAESADVRGLQRWHSARR